MSATEARVLNIEDNDAMRAMLFTILRHQQLGVDTSAGAEDARDVAALQPGRRIRPDRESRQGVTPKRQE